MKFLFVITGANKGLGLSLLKEVVQRGFQIEAIGRSPLDHPLGVSYTRMDCANPKDVEIFWHRISKQSGDETDVVLINNAGKYYLGGLTETDLPAIRQVFDDNLFTAISMTKGFVKYFKHGTIINLNSFAALNPREENSIYGAAKAAQAHLFSALRKELPPGRFRIMNLYPYRINTWSERPEPNTIDKTEIASWIIDTALISGSFEIADCTILPFGEE